MPRSCAAIHVMDREADSYELFDRLIKGGHRFVVRTTHDRNLGDGCKLLDALVNATILVEREVSLSARVGQSAPSARKIHPPREGRIAKLAVSATRVAVKNPLNKELSLELNVVRVLETDPPADCPRSNGASLPQSLSLLRNKCLLSSMLIGRVGASRNTSRP